MVLCPPLPCWAQPGTTSFPPRSSAFPGKGTHKDFSAGQADGPGLGSAREHQGKEVARERAQV